MNVSFLFVRRLAALVVLIAGCADDPSLDIVVEPPTETDPQRPVYAALIQKTAVTVYESETLTCKEVELGDADDETLLGVRVAEQTVTRDNKKDGQLDDISRLGKKIIVARMLDGQDVLIAAGCAEQGDLSGPTTVTIKTFIAASVNIDTVNTEDPYARDVTLIDPAGDVMTTRPVHYRLFAPAGATPASSVGLTLDSMDPTIWSPSAPVCTGVNGVATIRFATPAKVTGFAARFRISWPATRPDVISGFVRAGVGVQTLTDPPPSKRCAVRTLGERRVVCLQGASTATPRAHRFEVTQAASKHYMIQERLPAKDLPAVPPNPKTVGLFAFEEPGLGKEVYAVLEDGNVINVFGNTPLTQHTCGAACEIDDFRIAPGCSADDPPRIYMHSKRGAPIRVMPIHGKNPLEDFGTGEAGAVTLNSVGCASAVTAAGFDKDVQVVVLDIVGGDGAATKGAFRCGPTRVCKVSLPFPGAGVGFLKAGTENHMVGTAFDIDGAELIGWVLRPTADNQTYVLVERQRITAASPPVTIFPGKFDNDSEQDFLWTMRGIGRSLISQFSYGKTIEGKSRLSALAPLPLIPLLPLGAGQPIDELVVGDVNGDGFDDVIGTNPIVFGVFPQNADGPAVPDRTEESPACAQ